MHCKLIFSRLQKGVENVKGNKMPLRQSTGSRIRERRNDLRIRQSDLAAAAGISASYLNLIEHDRRRIGGKILNDIARALQVEPGLLAEGTETALLDTLRTAAATLPSAGAEVPRTEEFAARFPGWAALIASLAAQNAGLAARVTALTDRLANDPKLASSLHEVISAVTSIRSTSSILVGNDDIDRDWQGRFHQNIYQDSQRLAEASRELIQFLDAPKERQVAVLSPIEQVEAFLGSLSYHIPALEGGDPVLSPEAAAQGGPGVGGAAATQMLVRQLTQYRQDVQALPLAPFQTAAREADYDPIALARQFGVPVVQVLRRLAALPPDQGHPPFGLAVCDAGGTLIMQKPAPGFSLPRGGGICPIWPIFGAFSAPERPLRVLVELPQDPVQHHLCYAVAVPSGELSYGRAVHYRATMLVRPDVAITKDGTSAEKVGMSCRVCPRRECGQRREPSIL